MDAPKVKAIQYRTNETALLIYGPPGTSKSTSCILPTILENSANAPVVLAARGGTAQRLAVKHRRRV